MISLCESIAWMLTFHSKNWEWGKKNINFKDWPECDAKRLMVEFSILLKSKPFDYVQSELEEKILMLDSGELPECRDTLLRVYEDALNEHSLSELTHDLIRHPGRAVEAIERYMKVRPSPKKALNFADVIHDTIAENEANFKSGNSVVRISEWGYLSDSIGGFNPGRVGMVAAESGFGKTNLAVSLTLSASNNFPVLCVNMEMDQHDFSSKYIMSASKVNYIDWKTLKYDPLQLEGVVKYNLKNLNFTDGFTCKIEDIYMMSKDTGAKLVVVDYDQKIDFHMDYRTPEWKALQIAMENLEQMAKKLQCYVLVLAQADDNGNPSGSKRSRYPCSSVLRFYREEDGKNYITSTKNRFGNPNFGIEVEYAPSESRVKELKVHNDFKKHLAGIDKPLW